MRICFDCWCQFKLKTIPYPVLVRSSRKSGAKKEESDDEQEIETKVKVKGDEDAESESDGEGKRKGKEEMDDMVRKVRFNLENLDLS